MNQVLEKIYDTKSVEDAEGNIINPFPTATSYEIGTLFQNLIKEHKLDRTLEIGMAYGLSTMFICQAHRDKGSGSHIAIDPFQSTYWKSIGLLNIEKSGLSDILKFYQGLSYEVLPQLLAQDKIDFAFIDGSHHFDYTLVDFFYIDKLLEVGGYVVLDDIWMPGVRKVLYYILQNRAYEVVKTQNNENVGVRIKRLTKRFLQNPLERNYRGVKFTPGNICVLRKISEDEREWDFYRSF